MLRELHDELDAAVLAAYGLPPHRQPRCHLGPPGAVSTPSAPSKRPRPHLLVAPQLPKSAKSLSKQELVPLENTALEADSIEQNRYQREANPALAATLPEQVGAVARAAVGQPQRPHPGRD